MLTGAERHKVSSLMITDPILLNDWHPVARSQDIEPGKAVGGSGLPGLGHRLGDMDAVLDQRGWPSGMNT